MFLKRFYFIAILLCTHPASVNAKIYVQKKTLDNGFTILVRPVKTLQKVATQLWFGVGAKHEQSDEKGLAHWLEHMLFKGTNGPLNLSETDVDHFSKKLSGNHNAATSYDWTRYFFNLPVQYWHESLPVLAEMMQHCKFDQEMLNSELKVVIQELKMNRDHYGRQLTQNMLASIFKDHPYHDPVIGYKHHLWNLTPEKLHDFYKKHYVPNNAFLVVVGNVEPEEVFAKAETFFGSIPADENYVREEKKATLDICSHQLKLYRDIQQPSVNLYFVIPGIQKENIFYTDALSSLLTGGKNARLYRQLIDNKQLVNDIYSGSMNLIDHNLFIIGFEPKNIKDTKKIIKIIHTEIALLAEYGAKDHELNGFINTMRSAQYNMLENNFQQAEGIGLAYMTTGDENFPFNYIIEDKEYINNNIIDIIKKYLRPTVTHKGMILPLPDEEKEQLQTLQQESDIVDTNILSAKNRTKPVEPAHYAHQVKANNVSIVNVPKPEEATLANGLKIQYFHNDNIPKIEIILDLKISSNYEPDDLAGLSKLFSTMLFEGGTEQYSAKKFAKKLKKYGIGIAINPGSISLTTFSENLEKALTLLKELLCNAKLDTTELDKVKEWLLADIKHFWDSPRAVQGYLMDKHFYPNHPYSKMTIGTEESIKKIQRQDLIDFYKKFSTPYEATISIVGNIKEYNIPQIVEKVLGDWKGDSLNGIEYPKVQNPDPETITHYMERDQIVLTFAQLSIDQYHEDFYALTIFDLILNKYLFRLRELSGAFYGIGGSTLSGSGKQPGISLVQTMVSKDRLEEAEEIIRQALLSIPETMTQDDVDEAKRTILHGHEELYSTNASMASTFLFLYTNNFSYDYYEKKADIFNNITLEDIKKAAQHVLNPEKMSIFKVGRV